MINTKNWNLILEKLYNKYGENPDVFIMYRLTSEKLILDDYIIEYLISLTNVQKDALVNHNEKVVPHYSTCSTLVAYLLGLSAINPLPPHYYCSDCKRIEFIDYDEKADSCLYDYEPCRKCNCGNTMKIDGFNIPFELYAPYDLKIKEKGVVPLKYSDYSEELKRKFLNFPFLKSSQICHLLESSTGVMNDDINFTDEFFKKRILNGNFISRSNKINEFYNDVIKKVKPTNYNEFLKIIEFGHSIDAWKNNIEYVIEIENVKLSDIPVTKEDLYNLLYNRMINCLDNEYNTVEHKAINIALKASKGYYFKNDMDSYTKEFLLNIGFDEWFISYLSKIIYLPSKAMSVIEFKYILLLTWYDIYYKEEFKKVS